MRMFSFATAAFLMLAFKAEVGAAESLTNLGSIKIWNTLTWDAQPTNVYFKIYVGETNDVDSITNLVATTSTNYWSGIHITNLSGPKGIRLKGAMKVIDFQTGTTNEVTSGYSVPYSLTFDTAGNLVPPNNLQIYSVIYAAATNRVPVLIEQPPIPEATPIPTTKMFTGPEWQPSNRVK